MSGFRNIKGYRLRNLWSSYEPSHPVKIQKEKADLTIRLFFQRLLQDLKQSLDIFPVELGDEFHVNALRAGGLALVVVGAVTEAEPL